MAAPGRECHKLSGRKKDGENTGETGARERRHKMLKRGWMLKEGNRVNNKMKGTRQQGSDGRKERQKKSEGQWTAFRLRVPVPQERSTADAVALPDRCLSERTGHREAGSARTHIRRHLLHTFTDRCECGKNNTKRDLFVYWLHLILQPLQVYSNQQVGRPQ